jgi:hypothetical protein
MIVSLGLLGIGVGLTPFVTRLEQLLLLWGLLVGAGTGMGAIVLVRESDRRGSIDFVHRRPPQSGDQLGGVGG